jgi:hypothetical protein
MSVLQMQTIRNYTGEPEAMKNFSWDLINFGFTVVFACELALNALGHWFRPFVRSYWNLIDVIVVLLSLASLSQSYLNVNVVRMLRAVRVVRLFGKVEALKRVVAALSASVVPMANAFIILFIMISICMRPPYCLPGLCRQLIYLLAKLVHALELAVQSGASRLV